jgi:tetratricopeptide (TPR) repeat protein
MTAGPAGGSAADGRVAGYLGRVLAEGDRPVGTCFQVATGVLVTAWHVLNDIGAAAQDASVRVDPLAGGDAFDATVARVDPVHDLAVITTGTPLPALAGAFIQTDRVALRTQVTVTGHVLVEDEHTYRFLDAPGEWAGGTTRDDAVSLARMASTAVMRGMSGAPVVQDRDQAVAGVVSGRYNTADGWLTGTVWVARTEDLLPLLDGLAVVTVEQVALAGPVDLLLTMAHHQVRLTGPGLDVSASHSGVRPALAGAVEEVRRARARAGQVLDAQAQVSEQAGELSLVQAGKLLGESFLPGPVAAELERVLQQAARAYQPVRVGLAVEPGLAGLPWEALPSPDGRGPLALHPLVRLYRKAQTGTARLLPGPLRIVVAIASPDDAGGGVVDYERHLRSVIAAVRQARQDDADVRVVPFAVLAEIRAELERAPAHVLHLYGHGAPGRLELENEDGTARLVTAQEFLAEAIPPGAMPPVITLSACYTDAIAADDGASFATALGAHGAAAVIGTETSVTDTYATRLFARVYGRLARARDPDVIAALADARREVQHELETSLDKRDNLLAGLGEWAVVTVLAGSPAVAVLDPDTTTVVPRPAEPPQIAGLAARGPWYFVGRRAEQRSWPADLTSPGLAGIVVHGIGGTGKTTLAAELVARILTQNLGRILVSMRGPLTLEGLLGVVISAARRELLVRGGNGEAVKALDVAARADLAWADRWGVLRDHVLSQMPMLVVLDNFEDNLRPDGDAGYVIRDEVLAGLLAAWVGDPGLARLLVTSRYPFTLPGGAEQFLSFRPLGALSRAETMKLAWSLPALDNLDEGQLDRVWRLAGGHPRSLEYLDALLAGGSARYPDVTTRLHQAITRRLRGAEKDQWLAAHTSLDAALAETVALAADDVLLDDLLTRLAQVSGAADLLLGVSVYRESVDTNAVLFQAGQPDPDAENIPDPQAAYQRMTEILAAAGITVGDSLDPASVPEHVRAQLAPHMAELNRVPVPPFRPPPTLTAQIGACQAASLLNVRMKAREPQFFVHRWTATELSRRVAASDSPMLEQAHRQAAAYWQWRYQVWPQDQAADVHDLLEARHHLLQAGDTHDTGQVTGSICSQLHTWGAWDQEASLIYDTLTRLPADSPSRAPWIHQLGIIDQARGDYDEAARQYQVALSINERLGDQASTASSHHQLGILAQLRGDYDEAARQYQAALSIKERLGDQASTASTYHQLGILAQLRGDYDEATRQYQPSLSINERLGDQARTASTYHQLGRLAQLRGDYDEATRQYQRCLDIEERLGDQAGMARAYHNLGILAQLRGDYDEATRQYQRSLDINERLGNQAGMTTTYHQLGMLAQDRGDYDEATRQYQRSLDIEERLGNQVGMASSYGQLGILAHDRGDYDEAARQYKAALETFERLGDQANMATTYTQLGILEAEQPDGSAAAAVGWHVKALVIRLHLGAPQAANNLRRLAALRSNLGLKRFTSLLSQAIGDTKLAEAITSLLDQLDAADTGNA